MISLNKKGVFLSPQIIKIALIIFAVLLLTFISVKAIRNVNDETVYISCEINLDADIFSDVDIERSGSSCANKGTKCPIFLGIFSEKGKVTMLGSDGNSYGKSNYDIDKFPLPEEQNVIIEGCIPNYASGEITIKVVSDEGELQDEKTFIPIK